MVGSFPLEFSMEIRWVGSGISFYSSVSKLNPFNRGEVAVLD